MGKRRHLHTKIEQLLVLFPVVAVIGSRQCGKSTLVRQLRPGWRYYDLESPDDYQLISHDPVSFLTLNKQSLILDETQQYPDIFRVLRGVIDNDRQQKGRFLLTGSSSPEIVKGIHESLAGRIATVELAPFKQAEYASRPLPALYTLLTDPDTTADDFMSLQTEVTLEHCMQVWLQGGYPEPLLESAATPVFYKLWMDNYLSSYLDRDIRSLFPRLNLHNYRRFLTLLAQFSGHQLNMSDMARALEVSVSTVKDYLDIVHQTFIWRNLEPYTRNPLKKVQKANKGLFRDSGILHHLLRINTLDQLLLHPVAGYSFESFVSEEIIRGLEATLATRLEFSYYRTIDKSEVDLVIEGDFGTIPVEVKLNSTLAPRSLRGLEGFIADTGCRYGIVVNRGKRVERLSERIVQVPVQYV